MPETNVKMAQITGHVKFKKCLRYLVLTKHGMLLILKQRLIDCYLQEWRTDVSSNGVLRHLYSYVK
jgi:hypothetical protein